MNQGITNPTGYGLQNGLISFWNLEESSGTRLDSAPITAFKASANNLTANNAPANQAGKIGNAVALVRASNQYLSIASNSSLQFSSAMSLSAWVYFNTVPSTNLLGIVGKYTTTNNAINEYALDFAGSLNTWQFKVRIGSTQSIAQYTSIPTVSTWYFAVCVYNGSSITLYINNAAASTLAASGTLNNSSTSPFLIGAMCNTVGTELSSTAFDGAIDAVGLWNRALNAEEMTYLYNGGNGRQFPLL
jgi:hypothetical protein